jgi:hypothetical protein
VDAGAFPLAYWTLWDNIRLVETIPAAITLDPATLNLGSGGRWVTCYIELPAGYDVTEIDGATVTLDGIPASMNGHGWATPAANEHNIVDLDSDGTPGCRDRHGCAMREAHEHSIVDRDGHGRPACRDGHGRAIREADEDNSGDPDGDDVLARMVKFDRAAVEADVQPPQTTVTVQGYLNDGTLFQGTAVFQVFDKHPKVSDKHTKVPDEHPKKK